MSTNPAYEAFGGGAEHWIGVDLDGTLAQYDHFVDVMTIGEPIPAMVERVRGWLAEGLRVKVFTARVGPGPEQRDVEEVRRAVADWTERHVGTRLEVTNVKDYGMDELYDDRVVAVEQNTGRLLSASRRGIA